MKVYTVNILCHQGTVVLSLDKYYQSSKQAWFFGNQYLQSCPPAQDFEIKVHVLKPADVCALLNQ